MQAVKSLRFSGASVPRNYEGLVQRAIWTFQHQRVFDPSTRRVVHLQPIPEGGLVPIAGVRDLDFEHDRELAFLGPPLDNDLAAGIAAGNAFAQDLASERLHEFKRPTTLRPLPDLEGRNRAE